MRGVSSHTEVTTQITTIRGNVTPKDLTRIYQFVGFIEYGAALTHFTQLLKVATPEELAAIDRIVSENDEFTIYPNVSAQLASGPTTIVMPESARQGNPRRDRPTDSYGPSAGRTGLAWVIALARLEFGAMLAGYSDHPSPFTAVPTHAYDAAAYRWMLLDGAASHYWALVNDPALRKVTTTSPSNPIVLAYSRRLVVARSMLSAAIRMTQRNLSNIQMRELASWKESMDELQQGLVAKIQVYLGEQTVSARAGSKHHSHKYTDACFAMLRAEQRQRATSGP